MGNKRPTYTAEFKRNAVNLGTPPGYGYAQAGRSLGTHPNRRSRWQREQEAQGEHAYPGKGRFTPEQQRLHELEKENRRLPMERDILKKATVFFAKESTSGIHLLHCIRRPGQ